MATIPYKATTTSLTHSMIGRRLDMVVVVGVIVYIF
jgi:hypothetical protein